MRILVTGSGGFIGRRLLPLLGAHEVLCVTRNTRRDTDNLQFVEGDLTRPGGWQRRVESFAPDCCVHLAWDGLPDYSLARCRLNLDANVGLFETLVRAKTHRVVVAGSCWEYGPAIGPLSETTPPEPLSLFAATKHAIRLMLESVARDVGMDYRWARIFFAYGPGQREAALVPYLRNTFRTGGVPSIREPSAVNDFIHIDDVASALLALTISEGASGTFNIGSGRPTSVAEVANRVARYYGHDENFRVTETGPGFWADITKAESSIGWRPVVGIGEGIERTLRELDAAA